MRVRALWRAVPGLHGSADAGAPEAAHGRPVEAGSCCCRRCPRHCRHRGLHWSPHRTLCGRGARLRPGGATVRWDARHGGYVKGPATRGSRRAFALGALYASSPLRQGVCGAVVQCGVGGWAQLGKRAALTGAERRGKVLRVLIRGGAEEEGVREAGSCGAPGSRKGQGRRSGRDGVPYAVLSLVPALVLGPALVRCRAPYGLNPVLVARWSALEGHRSPEGRDRGRFGRREGRGVDRKSVV